MKSFQRISIALLLSSIVAIQPVLADPPPGTGNPNKGSQGNNGNNGNKGNSDTGQGQGNAQDNSSDLATGLVIAGITAIAAQNLATNYGMVGYAPLPPGIAKNLVRGKTLPPGIAKKYPPNAMLGQLPYHPGYEWRVAGSDLILVAIGTAIVADVLRNVFR